MNNKAKETHALPIKDNLPASPGFGWDGVNYLHTDTLENGNRKLILSRQKPGH